MEKKLLHIQNATQDIYPNPLSALSTRDSNPRKPLEKEQPPTSHSHPVWAWWVPVCHPNCRAWSTIRQLENLNVCKIAGNSHLLQMCADPSGATCSFILHVFILFSNQKRRPTSLCLSTGFPCWKMKSSCHLTCRFFSVLVYYHVPKSASLSFQCVYVTIFAKAHVSNSLTNKLAVPHSGKIKGTLWWCDVICALCCVIKVSYFKHGKSYSNIEILN